MTTSNRQFAGKIAVVTGAANGIGRAAALAYAREGADVAVLDREADALAETVELVRASGVRAFPRVGDMTKQDEVVETFAAIKRDFGPVDILLNNIGQTARENYSEFWQAKPETLQFVINVSLMTTLMCTRQVVEDMRERRAGKIVSISSDSAMNGDIGTVDYASAKSGVLGFTRALARELGPFKVNVNAICPGPTNTRAMQRIPRDAYERAKNAIPLGELCEPEDIANAAVFLSSVNARFITGQTLMVNGGRVFY
ncbi:SDR family oxidoreductase [Bradyrhizobium sp. U87765 SZCCT0131]|nr:MULTISPECIES: SDR family oxidoreductase [unclassified Bradyrhizobium]MBR1218015.1 SDR family oxidoreductase [Bradyrhizobium sp. U87765 SZCCT0131]MBR1261039.1 SDR family oxidoreductase [Bradyrhizobium sp. U87765 SZCCT0134]MBR1303513.1 SDR family oxidoreductase [Bradyrhizobium sp. U87765 SZCCT0110]MBR1319119.1 SDR family oxidoreductase [Bradyrhizobium sp. U87765 SZCCT0109]MBR1347444.1 SDR family oxidoreductase [Bradyrhizobium sp. U87765 SZCCT0048]